MTPDEREAVERVKYALNRGVFDRFTSANGVPLSDDLRALLRLAEQGASRTVEQKTRA